MADIIFSQNAKRMVASGDAPAVADGENVMTRCPMRLPGAAALLVNGMRFVASLKVSRSETEPGAAGVSSMIGVSGAVMPARVKVIDWTAADGV